MLFERNIHNFAPISNHGLSNKLGRMYLQYKFTFIWNKKMSRDIRVQKIFLWDSFYPKGSKIMVSQMYLHNFIKAAQSTCCRSLPCKVKMQYVHFKLYTPCFLLPSKIFLNKLANDQCSLINKGSIYHIKHMSIQPFAWRWIDLKWSVKWKYLACFIFAHTVFFTFYSRINNVTNLLKTNMTCDSLGFPV